MAEVDRVLDTASVDDIDRLFDVLERVAARLRLREMGIQPRARRSRGWQRPQRRRAA